MFCKNCGNKACGKFCENCGEPTSETVPKENDVNIGSPVPAYSEIPLKICGKCSKSIPKYAKVCPHCFAGQPTVAKGCGVGCLAIIGVVVLFAIIGAIVASSEYNKKDFIANEIIQDYSENIDKANKRFSNGEIRITGIIYDINKNNINLIGIDKKTTEYINCKKFDDESLDMFDTLKKGDEISVYGTVWGFAISSIVVEKCRIDRNNVVKNDIEYSTKVGVEELEQSFIDNGPSAKKFYDKNDVVVIGVVSYVYDYEDGRINVSVKDATTDATISCDFELGEKLTKKQKSEIKNILKLKEGDSVSIKGKASRGWNTVLCLDDCAITK